MKKVLVFVIALLVIATPMSFAKDIACEWADSSSYLTAAGGKLTRGIANAAFGWVELLRQPAINENAWEGVGRGIVHAIGRTGSGILEVATFVVPQAKIPLLDPACPLDMMASTNG